MGLLGKQLLYYSFELLNIFLTYVNFNAGLFPPMNLRRWLWIVLKDFIEMLGVNGQIYRIIIEIRCGINLGYKIHKFFIIYQTTLISSNVLNNLHTRCAWIPNIISK